MKSDGVTQVYSKTVKLNAKSFKLVSSAIDKALLFNKLSEGTYYYVVDATDASGKKLNVVKNKFTVVKKVKVDFNYLHDKTSEADIKAAIEYRNLGIVAKKAGCTIFVREKLIAMGYNMTSNYGNGIVWYKNFKNGKYLLNGYGAECVRDACFKKWK